jgi:tetratricopeptide (TPR) repeat protein
MLISTTITGGARADVIGRSLATIAPEVDLCLVIDTGTTDNAIEVARAAVSPEKFHVVQWPWQNDFAAARNFALDYARDWLRMRPDAARAGTDDPRDWVLTADTDEFPRYPGARAFLASVPPAVDCVLVRHVSGSYRQTRAFRATTRARWDYPVHECCTGYTPIDAPPEWCFECIPRPHEDRTAKYEKYRDVLTAETQKRPTDPRPFYYLGDTLSILGYKGSAVKAFNRCAKLPGWPQQAAWACYRAAILLFELGMPIEAINQCRVGIARSPKDMPELHWLAGWIAYQTGDHALAAAHAKAALAIGPQPQRGGFSYPKAQRELPEQLLQWAEHQLAKRPTVEAPSAPESNGPVSSPAGDSLPDQNSPT